MVYNYIMSFPKAIIIASIFACFLFLAHSSVQANFVSPYELRVVMFRMMNFFTDLVDTNIPTQPGSSGSRPPQGQPQPTQPPSPQGSCPFQTVAYIRECLDQACQQTRPVSEFDNNQQYGIANDQQIKNRGNQPDPNLPFAHRGNSGESIIVYTDLAFPTADGYFQGDATDIKLFLDANSDSQLDNNWEIVKKACESYGTTIACPNSQAKYESNQAPLTDIQGINVDCNVNIRY